VTNELHDDAAALLTRAIREAFETLFPHADACEVTLREEQIQVTVFWPECSARDPETWTYDVLGDDEVLVFHTHQGRRRKTMSIPRPEGV